MKRRLLLAAFTIVVAPAGAQASSFAALGAGKTLSPSIIFLGTPAPAPAEADAEASVAPDPLQTAALSATVPSPSIIMLGEPARASAATDPDSRDESTPEPKPSPRVASLPTVMRGDFGELRGSTDSAAASPAPAETAPAAETGGETNAPAEQPAPQPEKAAAKPEPENTPDPAELDR